MPHNPQMDRIIDAILDGLDRGGFAPEMRSGTADHASITANDGDDERGAYAVALITVDYVGPPR